MCWRGISQIILKSLPVVGPRGRHLNYYFQKRSKGRLYICKLVGLLFIYFFNESDAKDGPEQWVWNLMGQPAQLSGVYVVPRILAFLWFRLCYNKGSWPNCRHLKGQFQSRPNLQTPERPVSIAVHLKLRCLSLKKKKLNNWNCKFRFEGK